MIAYFDCFSGASGDMILGALLDAGMPLAYLRRRLRLVKMGEFSLVLRKDPDLGGTNLEVVTAAEPASSDYRSLDRAISSSGLKGCERDLARAILARLARAEAAVHRKPVERVHFHEVGATDSLVDIVGAAVGICYFGFDEVHCSPLPMSRGEVKCEHGTLPVPAPATIELLKGVPLERTRLKGELVTPTGAAILTEISKGFGSCPLQSIERVGHGFGDRAIRGRPNMLRLMLGEGFRAVAIETDIDDMDPRLFEPVMQKLFKAGAVDVTLRGVQMKKGRPAVRLGCIAPWELKDRLMEMILEETTTFGVRYWPVERKMLSRRLETRRVKGGEVTFKLGLTPEGRVIKAVPEFEDLRRLARKEGRPLIDVHAEAEAKARKLIKY